MRDSEIKRPTWSQIDWDKKILAVGLSKDGGRDGAHIPLNATLLQDLLDHTR